MPSLDTYLDQNAARFEDDLCELLRIPSVSADTARRGDVDRAADWVLGQFQSLGLKAEKIPTAGNPLIYAESPPVPDMPVALVYGHYDVQPVDPLSEWLSPPFEPTRRNGNIYARGATDDKGQMLTHIKGAEAWLKTTGKLPIQLKFLIEGEEEVGSENLDPFIAGHKEKLACDVVVISDSSQFAPGKPAITYGLRGIAYYRTSPHRSEARPAFRHVRRRSDQSGQRAVPHDGGAVGFRRPRASARLLRRRRAAHRRRTPPVSRSAVRRSGVYRISSASRV